jgi:hypothetical protein
VTATPQRMMTRRAAQPARTPSPMSPRAETLAPALVPRAIREVPATAQLFRAGQSIFVGGGGTLIEVNVDRPPEQWESRPIPSGLFARDPGDAPPLLVDDSAIHRLDSFASLLEIHRLPALAGGASAYSLAHGRVLVCTMRTLTGTYLLDAAGKTLWRARRTDPLLAVFDDVAFAVGDGEPNLIICRDTGTGEERWKYRGTRAPSTTLVAVVDDTVWISDGTALVQLGLLDGRERSLLDLKVFASMPRLAPDGCAHLVFGSIDHWVLDLRAAAIVSRRRFAASSGSPYPMEPLAGGAVLVRDRANMLYRLEGGDGEDPLPLPLWKAPAFPVCAIVHGEGLLVLTEPSGAPRVTPMRAIHWLAPANI